ncbi:MAG: hypothetical protein SGILL_002957 [Bacillariaceae sp.]
MPIVVFFLALIGIACSIVVCFSVDYFSFVSLRNDTFTDQTGQKTQPHPFEHATEANVGIFRYEILDVYTYPWPPKQQERRLFDEMHERELQRLARKMQGNETTDEDEQVPVDVADDADGNTTDVDGLNSTLTNETDTSNNTTDIFEEEDDEVTKPPDVNLTAMPTGDAPALPPSEIPDVLPGNSNGSQEPTGAPSGAPTISNPNDAIEAEIGIVKPYPDGIGQFDQMFTNAQRGAMLAPIFAFVGLFFSCIEFCCCTYKCSWLPGAIFLYAAFMFQLMTLFLFMSEDFCKYDQDCALGFAGFLSVIAVITYFICQNLVCCTPRPPPIFNCCKKKTVRRKKKKKKSPNSQSNRNLEDDDSNEGFRDEPEGYVDPYDEDENYDEDDYDQPQSYYDSNATDDQGYGESEDTNYEGYEEGDDTYDGYGDGTYDDTGDYAGDSYSNR